MDIREQVKLWVENKFEKIINDYLKNKVVEENSLFDVEEYVNYLFGKYLYKNDTENLKSFSLNSHDLLDFELDILTGEQNNEQYSLEFEYNENFSTEELIKNLENSSEKAVQKSLQTLEISAEDLINQNSWNKITEALKNVLNKTSNRDIQTLVLKVFRKMLKWHKKIQISSVGFAGVAKVFTDQINQFNLENGCNSLEKFYDLKEEKWDLEKKASGFENLKYSTPHDKRPGNPEVLIKLMWLLIDYQHQIHVNESRYREIIFCFIQSLSTTTTSERNKLSGLELLSVLSPRASWCHAWCHTAVGRTLLCSALRKHKNFLVQVIEVVINKVKLKKASVSNDDSVSVSLPKLEKDVLTLLKPLNVNLHISNKTKKEKTLIKIKNSESRSNKSIRSAPSEYTSWGIRDKNTPAEWIVEWIPRKIVNEAVFFHCISFISCLIKFRSGRALFPVQVISQRRLLTVQDIALSIIEYLKNINCNKQDHSDVAITSAYQAKTLEMLDFLKSVSTEMNSFRMRAKKSQFSYF